MGPDGMLRFAVVTPIFNDVEAFRTLCIELNEVADQSRVRLSVVGIDDGSWEPVGLAAGVAVPSLESIEVFRLVCNLGHQRAIAVGLAELARRVDYDAAIVMDCDGEDRPSDIVRLIAAHRANPGVVIAAQRTKRSEGLRFRLFYALYRALFTALTGRGIDFGNFLLIPQPMVARLAHMPEIWNHVAAAILRSRVPVVRLPTERGRRYAGSSSMNLVSLLAHGLSAIAVFGDLVFVRLLVLASAISGLALILGIGAVAVRVATDLAIPGWASNVVGISAIILFQAVTLSVFASLTFLGSRSAIVFIPARNAGDYVAERTILAERCSPHPKSSNTSVQSSSCLPRL